MVKAYVLGAAACAVFVAPAQAVDFSDWTVSPYEATIGDNLQLKLSGTANGSAYVADQPDAPGLDQSGVTGAAVVAASLQRSYDSGLSISLKSAFQVYHDRLSVDNYGGDFVEKVYGVVQTGLGRVEMGNADGAAYALAVTGPVVEGDISIDNTNVSFFKDPSTGQAFINIFALNSATEASLNYAKISYYSPRLFGVQIAGSFTPSEGKDVLPFLDSGPDIPDRQKSIWEAVVSYNGNLGPVTTQFSGAWSTGHDDTKTPGHAGLTEWSIGGQADYDLNDDIKLSLGGAHRSSNAYAFNINSVFSSGETTSNHLSATLTTGPWIVGGELGEGNADGRLGSPNLGVHGVSATVGYVLNSNLELNAGWEQYLYKRDAGVFYNGRPRIRMDAGFLHLQFQI